MPATAPATAPVSATSSAPAPRHAAGTAPPRASAGGDVRTGRLPIRRLALALCAALALHALLLGAVPHLAGPAPGLGAGPAATSPALQTRQIQLSLPRPAAHTAAAPPDGTAAPLPSPARQPATVRTAQAAAVGAAAVAASPATDGAIQGAANLTMPGSKDEAAVTPAAIATPPPAADAAAAEVAPPPVYATALAPPATLEFSLKRGQALGQAVLQWRPEPDSARYTLTLQAQALGVALAGWNSSGRLDSTGLAPERYAETRRQREVRATNFQRQQGRVSFSALALDFPLVPGMQDRSSWLLQLGAILQAQPELAQIGAQVTLVVVGTRGPPEPWVFTVVERSDLLLPDARIAGAVQLLREPRRPYDTRAQVWLDPARHHLPVKVQLLVAATGEGQTLELRQLNLP